MCEGFANGTGSITVVRVPGRLDVMGGIADYSGSVVCQGTLAPAVVLGLQARKDQEIHIRSLGLATHGLAEQVTFSLGEFRCGKGLANDVHTARLFKRDPSVSWAAYVAGAFPMLLSEGIVTEFPRGFNVVIQSGVPLGAGIASSAAVEVAVMHAMNRKLNLGLDGVRVSHLCQLVENRVVGAPCGIMDQMITALGKKDSLLAIRCQPGEVMGEVRMPASCAVAGINSKVKHAVGGSRYTDVRVSAFMGHKIILDRLGLDPGEDPFRGYLANIKPEQYRKKFRRMLPLKMKGKDFLRYHEGTVDPVTKVEPEKRYRIRSRTEHPVYENHRVTRFIKCLENAEEKGEKKALAQAGRLMYASHWSYRMRCGLDSPETHLLVNLARSVGIQGGIYGAKITGGGSGGTVAVLGRRDTLEETMQGIAAEYEAQTGVEPDLFLGSSPGAEAFGHLEYEPLKGG